MILGTPGTKLNEMNKKWRAGRSQPAQEWREKISFLQERHLKLPLRSEGKLVEVMWDLLSFCTYQSGSVWAMWTCFHQLSRWSGIITECQNIHKFFVPFRVMILFMVWFRDCKQFVSVQIVTERIDMAIGDFLSPKCSILHNGESVRPVAIHPGWLDQYLAVNTMCCLVVSSHEDEGVERFRLLFWHERFEMCRYNTLLLHSQRITAVVASAITEDPQLAAASQLHVFPIITTCTLFACVIFLFFAAAVRTMTACVRLNLKKKKKVVHTSGPAHAHWYQMMDGVKSWPKRTNSNNTRFPQRMMMEAGSAISTPRSK